MLSYLLPVEDKSHPSQNLNLDLNLDSDNLKPTKCAANETSDKECLPTIFESRNISVAFKKSTATDRNNFIKKTAMASSEVQRPKSLDKLNVGPQPTVISMETVNEDTGNIVSGSILSGASMHAAPSTDGKFGKTSKLGHNKNAALKRYGRNSNSNCPFRAAINSLAPPRPLLPPSS